MTSILRRWCVSVATDIAVAAAFWRGCLLSEGGWLNLFTFFVWFFAIVGVFSFAVWFTAKVLYTDKEFEQKISSKVSVSKAFFRYCVATRAAVLIALVWIGWFWTAGFYCFALIGELAAKPPEKNEREQQRPYWDY
jgi:hypothetical protein